MGEANIQIWIKNGTVWLTSRYRTFSAESHRPTPSAVRSARIRQAGKATMAQVGPIANHAIMHSRMRNDKQKSTKGGITAARGMINRGKYTLVIRPASPTTLFPHRP